LTKTEEKKNVLTCHHSLAEKQVWKTGKLFKNTYMHPRVYSSCSFEINCACLRMQEMCMIERTKNGLKTIHMKCKSGEIFL